MKLTQYLNKSLELQETQEHNKKIDSKLTSLFHGKPFYCWDKEHEGNCCFNNVIGLPQKEGREYPLFDYEQDIINILEDNSNPNDIKHKHLWIVKSTGLGLSELALRYITYLCLRDNKLAYSQVSLITGPRIELAISLIDRMKGLFERNNLARFDTKSTVLYLNNVRIEAYPSHHVDAMRGQQNVSFVFLDEADFFPPGQQQDARLVSERYVGKSNPYLLMVSTPGRPEGLFQSIQNEPEDKCIYHRLKLDYRVGLGKIYSQEDITRAMASPSFKQEYCLQYGGNFGDIFNQQDIDAAITDSYDIKVTTSNPFATRYMGIDPAWGSSKFGIVVVEWYDYSFRVLYAESWDRPLFNEAIDEVITLAKAYSCCKLLCDGANPSVIKSLKKYYGSSEFLNYERLEPEVIDRWAFSDCEYNKVVPLNWRLKHRELLQKAHQVLSKRQVKINSKFTKLITALRTATNKENSDTFDLDKQKTTESDVLDSFIAAIYPVQLRFQV